MDRLLSNHNSFDNKIPEAKGYLRRGGRLRPPRAVRDAPLYGQDVLTEREYGEKRRELRPDHGSEGVPGGPGFDLVGRFETLQGLYDRGLLTEEEYAEKRRDILEKP